MSSTASVLLIAPARSYRLAAYCAAAEVLGIARNSAYEAVKEGQIPSMRVGRRILVLWGPFMRKIGSEDEQAA